MIGKTNSIAKTKETGETATIILTTNQSSHSDLTDVTVSVSVDGRATDYIYSGQFTVEIPKDSVYTVTFPEVDGYKTPDSVTYTAVKGFSRGIEAVYYTEAVTVDVSAYDSASVDGKNVWVSLTPTEGIYIEDTNLNLWNTEDWDGSATPNGIAVITGKSSFVIALEQPNGLQKIESYDTAPYDGYLASFTDEISARNDFNGDVNTSNMMKVESSSSFAAGFCGTYLFPSGENGFLPSLGQWAEVYNNKNQIEAALVKVGGDGFFSDRQYWSSTYNGYNSVNYHSFWYFMYDGGSATAGLITNNLYVRPFKNLGCKQYPITNDKASFKVPYDETYTVSVDDMDGYQTPESKTYTASQATRTIDMQYTELVEHVVVNVSADDGASMDGRKVFVTKSSTGLANQYTVSNGKVEFDMPTGEEYTISFADVDGYATPSSQTFTAGTGTRTVDVVYNAVQLGIFIATYDGRLVDPSSWNESSSNAVGVAVCTENSRYIIGRSSTQKTGIAWCSDSDVPGVPTSGNITTIATYYDGQAYTDAMVSVSPSTLYAAGYARSIEESIDGDWKMGYLGSAGEWQDALNNHQAITDAFSKIGETFVGTYYYFWTSCKYSQGSAWRALWREGNNSFSLAQGSIMTSDSMHCVVPFFKI